MTRDEIITLLLRRAGQREGDNKLQGQLEKEIQFVQTSLERSGVLVQLGEGNATVFWPNFLLSEIATASSSSGDSRVEIPSDFLSECLQGTLFLDDSGEWQKLEKRNWDYLRWENSAQGKPESYTLLGDYFYLFPVPDGSYTMKLVYYQSDAVLDGDVENRWLKYAPELILTKLGEIMAYQYLYDFDLAKSFQDMHTRAALAYYQADIDRITTNRGIPYNDGQIGGRND